MSLCGMLLRGFGAVIVVPPDPPEPLEPAQPYLFHSPSDVIRHLLVNLGVGSLPSSNTTWPIWSGFENDQPDNAMTVYSTSGILMGRIQSNGNIPEQYGIQFRARANNDTDAYRKIAELQATIDETILENTVTIDGTIYIVPSVNRKGGILSLGKESPQTKRHIYTLNAVATIQRHSS